MTRVEYEQAQADQRGLTRAEMGLCGFYSAICRCGQDDCCGWQTVARAPALTVQEWAVTQKEFAGLALQRFNDGA